MVKPARSADVVIAPFLTLANDIGKLDATPCGSSRVEIDGEVLPQSGHSRVA